MMRSWLRCFDSTLELLTVIDRRVRVAPHEAQVISEIADRARNPGRQPAVRFYCGGTNDSASAASKTDSGAASLAVSAVGGSVVRIIMKAKIKPATAPIMTAVVRSTPSDLRNPGERRRRACLAFSAGLILGMGWSLWMFPTISSGNTLLLR